MGRPIVIADHRDVSTNPEDDFGVMLDERDPTMLDALVSDLLASSQK